MEQLHPVNVNDVEKAVELPLQQGAVYVFGKGYSDYNWWHRIDAADAQFYHALQAQRSAIRGAGTGDSAED